MNVFNAKKYGDDINVSVEKGRPMVGFRSASAPISLALSNNPMPSNPDLRDFSY